MYVLLTRKKASKNMCHVLYLLLKKYPNFVAASHILLTGQNKLSGAFFISHCVCILLIIFKKGLLVWIQWYHVAIQLFVVSLIKDYGVLISLFQPLSCILHSLHKQMTASVDFQYCQLLQYHFAHDFWHFSLYPKCQIYV